jgi:hypothetical protein
MTSVAARAFLSVVEQGLSQSARSPSVAVWFERLVLLDPAAIDEGLLALAEVRARPPVDDVGDAVAAAVPSRLPSRWQVALGILRMQHRLLTRRASVGLASLPREPGLWPRLLEQHVVRAPFLLLEGSVVPHDLSGLRSKSSTLQRHLLGTYHAGNEANYDLEILAARDPQALVTLREACIAVVDGRHPRARRWRSLCVYAGAHEELLAQIDRALRGEFLGRTRDDPDVSFFAFLRFCARQPADPNTTAAAWQTGRYHLEKGLTT